MLLRTRDGLFGLYRFEVWGLGNIGISRYHLDAALVVMGGSRGGCCAASRAYARMYARGALLLASCTAVVDQKHLAVRRAGGLGVEPAPDLVFSVVSAWADAVQQVDNSSWIHRGKGAALIIDAAHARCGASACSVSLLLHISPALLDLRIYI